MIDKQKQKQKQKIILGGDIGATKTGLALYSVLDNEFKLIRRQRFLNSEYQNLPQIIDFFLCEEDQPLIACLGVAGPVSANTVRMTNLDWFINGEEIKQRYGLDKVFVVNDLIAAIMGAIRQPQEQLYTINFAKPNPDGAIAILAAGTGLGEAFLIRDKNRLLPVGSEGGHAGFAPCNREQLELLSFLFKKNSHVSVEKVCSGLGIVTLFYFLAEKLDVSKDLQVKLAGKSDKTPVIITCALKALAAGNYNHICVRVLRIFADILAAESANLALKTLSTGGLFIGGGLPPKILPFLAGGNFMSIFGRGVYRQLLADIPVHIVLDPQAPLLGAAVYGAEQILKESALIV